MSTEHLRNLAVQQFGEDEAGWQPVIYRAADPYEAARARMVYDEATDMQRLGDARRTLQLESPEFHTLPVQVAPAEITAVPLSATVQLEEIPA